jgi:hypothetical protein
VKHLIGLIAVAGMAVLVGCGGGGDSGSNAPTIDLSTVHNDRTILSYSITGWRGTTANTVTGTESVSYGAKAATTLNGMPAMVQDISYVNSYPYGTYSYTDTVYSDPVSNEDLAYSRLATSTGVSNAYGVYTSFVWPVVTAGSSGSLYTVAGYTDSTLASPLRHSQVSYAAFADTSSSLLVVYTTQTFDNDNVLIGESISTDRVTTAGVRTRLENETLDFAADGKTVTLDYVYTPQ